MLCKTSSQTFSVTYDCRHAPLQRTLPPCLAAYRYFATGGESFKPEPEKKAGELIAEELKIIREEMAAFRKENKQMKEQLDNQETFNKEFVIPGIQQIKGEVSSIRGSIERDKELDESNRAAKEAKQLIAAANENPDTNLDKQKKGFFARLFGK
ncbi:hypothetical protein ACQKIC_04875 [Peribacillus sp. NPDC046944]|uniref:hypothetical protein n=1 Tax=Peribacillus sp. NPDC046944 TaxID=3390607 RepID=UPI003CFCBB35